MQAPEEVPARLVDISSLPAIYIDGIAKIVVIGQIVRLTCFEYRQIGDERVKMPNLEIVSPLATSGEWVLMLQDEPQTTHH